MNLEKARFNMIEQQVRPWNVSDERVRQLLAEVPREAFAPAKYRDLAFADTELPLLDDEALVGDAAQTAPLPQGPFDAIVLSGSVARAPQHLIAQLAPGGRLLAITGDEPVMRATLVQLQGEGVRLTQPWDCGAPRLMNFPDTPVFHF